MQVTETVSEGLKRELKIVVQAPELQERVNSRLEEMKDKVRLKGFRPGMVPVEHLRKLYGRSVMAEVLEQTISETSKKALVERDERPADKPDISLPEDEKLVEGVIAGERDLEYTMSFEVLPEMELVDLRKLEIEKPVAEVAEDEIEKGLGQLLDSSTSYEDKKTKAKDGDQVRIDFIGRIDGEAFEGGTAEDVAVVIGKNAFIPGFEDGLVGVRAGDETTITTTFPENYPAKHLAGKAAEFEVKVRAVAAPKRPEPDDEFASGMGFESIDKLREAVRERLAKELEGGTRVKMKRGLLDALDEAHDFDLPPSLVEREFADLWAQLNRQMEQRGETFSDLGQDEDAEKEKNRKLAERRVRLGLVLSEIGRQNKIEVSDDDLKRAMLEQARQYPGQEKKVIEYFQKTPGALMDLHAPIYEDKVVNYALALVKQKERKVTSKELFDMAHEEDVA